MAMKSEQLSPLQILAGLPGSALQNKQTLSITIAPALPARFR
jgi:hypothetical protein